MDKWINIHPIPTQNKLIPCDDQISFKNFQFFTIHQPSFVPFGQSKICVRNESHIIVFWRYNINVFVCIAVFEIQDATIISFERERKEKKKSKMKWKGKHYNDESIKTLTHTQIYKKIGSDCIVCICAAISGFCWCGSPPYFFILLYCQTVGLHFICVYELYQNNGLVDLSSVVF